MIQKNQCLAIDKLVKTKGKVAEAAEVEVDPAVKEVVLDQMDQWTEMIERHRLAVINSHVENKIVIEAQVIMYPSCY
jgi:hypothetical protein